MKIWFQNRRYKTKRKQIAQQAQSSANSDYNDDEIDESELTEENLMGSRNEEADGCENIASENENEEDDQHSLNNDSSYNKRMSSDNLQVMNMSLLTHQSIRPS